jgi:hypothetical protein
MPPLPRERVFDAYWHFAAERQRIYISRLAGEQAPWTDDPILSTFKFCNAYRASDRVSQYLIREVIYADPAADPEDLLLRIVLFRLFSKPETWELLEAGAGVNRKSLRRGQLAEILDAEALRGRKLYTGAFILCATRAYGHQRKHRNHLALLEEMMAPGGLSSSVAGAASIGKLYEALRRYPLIGPFMAYQLAIDINYSELCDFDESEAAVAGPGALRGIAKCFSTCGDWDPERVILWMTERQDQEFERLGIKFPGLFGRPLQAIDIQNLFCEVDKYSRVAFPELKSDRSRIKSRFAASGNLPVPFFPPKWGLDPPALPLGSDQLALSVG